MISSQRPARSASLLLIVTAGWSISIALLISKYHIAITDESRVSMMLGAVVASIVCSAILQKALYRKYYTVYWFYQQLSVVWLVMLLILSTML